MRFMCLTLIGSKLFSSKISIKETSTTYGMCTLQDCDIGFNGMRLSRLVRDLDFARLEFFDRTGLFQRIGLMLQGCTLTVISEPVPLFIHRYTKLVYWDDHSLFFEHQVVTTGDGRVRALIVSRQHGIGWASSVTLLKGIEGSETRPPCPDYIRHWLDSIETSSKKFRA